MSANEKNVIERADSPEVTFGNLNEDVLLNVDRLLQIGRYLTWRELLNLSSVSSRWDLLLAHNYLWRPLYERFFSLDELPRNVFQSDDFFKRAFLTRIKGILKHVVTDPRAALLDAPDALKNDKEFLLEAVHRDSYVLRYVSGELQKNPEIVLAAVCQNGLALRYAPELQNNRDVVLAAVRQEGLALMLAPELQKNPEIVLAAVGQNGLALEFASDALRNDPDVVLAAVGQNGLALQYASAALKNDPEVVLEAVGQNGYALQCASKELQNNRDVVLEVVGQNGLALYYASEALKSDKEIVLAAVGQNGYALRYASEALKSDKEIVLAAVGEDGYALDYASNELKNNRAVVLAAVGEDGYALDYASNELKNNRAVVLAAVGQNGSALRYASELTEYEMELQEEGERLIHRMWETDSESGVRQEEMAELKNLRGSELESYIKFLRGYLEGVEEYRNMPVPPIPLPLEFASAELQNNKEFALGLERNGLSNDEGKSEQKEERVIGQGYSCYSGGFFASPAAMQPESGSELTEDEMVLREEGVELIHRMWETDSESGVRQKEMAELKNLRGSELESYIKFLRGYLEGVEKYRNMPVPPIPLPLEFASAELQNNKEFVLELERNDLSNDEGKSEQKEERVIGQGSSCYSGGFFASPAAMQPESGSELTEDEMVLREEGERLIYRIWGNDGGSETTRQEEMEALRNSRGQDLESLIEYLRWCLNEVSSSSTANFGAKR